MATSTPTQTLAVVLRPFEGAGLLRSHGEVVDVSDWRSGDSLTRNRYLAPFQASDPAPENCSVCGRQWKDRGALIAHISALHAVAEGGEEEASTDDPTPPVPDPDLTEE